MAARDIKPWEAVLQDEALVVAPGDHPLCVLCLVFILIFLRISMFLFSTNFEIEL